MNRLCRNCAIVWFCLASAVLANEPSHRTPILPSIPEKVFRATDFGAVGDGTTDNAKSLQKAIDSAKAAGGGIVELPPGKYLCGPIHLSSQINLRLDADAVLIMLPFDKYPGGLVDPPNLIEGDDLHDIAITGAGTIDGQGAPWWPYAKKDKAIKRPRMIAIRSSQRVLIEGVRLVNSPMFHIAIGGKGGSDITVRRVTIRANSSTDPVTPSHNTDACDVSAAHVLIQECDVSVGDDNFTCGGGTSDVLITHCTYGNGHGVSIGSYTRGGVSDFTVEHCTFANTENGIRIKSDRDRGGLVHNLTFRDLQMTNVGCPILIYGAYLAKGEFRRLKDMTPDIVRRYPQASVTDVTPIYQDITFQDITATAAKGRGAGLIWGLAEAPVKNVVLKNVNITADKPLGVFYARGVRLDQCKIATPSGINKIVSYEAEIDRHD